MMRLRYALASASLAAALLAPGPVLAAGDAMKGAVVFKRCKPCHALEAGGRKMLGPTLHGLFGRSAGSVPDFNYSKAMKTAGIVWDERSLDRYLADPKGFMPGNRMPFAGLKEAGERADLLAYLKQATR